MALITWNDSLSVNVEEIDHQHQKLISMINELHSAMEQGKGKDVLGKIIDGLMSYTATHFRTEEEYFAQYGYPEADSHKKEHAAFIQKVSFLKDAFEKRIMYLSIDVRVFLRDWLQNHIKGTDRKYSQFFNSKGLN